MDRPLKPAASVHMIGICGTGMAGLACILAETGYAATGSDDNVYPPMSDILRRAGIAIAPYSPANLEHRPAVVVLGAAVPARNPEATAAFAGKHSVLSYPEAVQRLVLDGREAHDIVVMSTGPFGGLLRRLVERFGAASP